MRAISICGSALLVLSAAALITASDHDEREVEFRGRRLQWRHHHQESWCNGWSCHTVTDDWRRLRGAQQVKAAAAGVDEASISSFDEAIAAQSTATDCDKVGDMGSVAVVTVGTDTYFLDHAGTYDDAAKTLSVADAKHDFKATIALADGAPTFTFDFGKNGTCAYKLGVQVGTLLGVDGDVKDIYEAGVVESKYDATRSTGGAKCTTDTDPSVVAYNAYVAYKDAASGDVMAVIDEYDGVYDVKTQTLTSEDYKGVTIAADAATSSIIFTAGSKDATCVDAGTVKVGVVMGIKAAARRTRA